jgi:hypothetical protein
MLLPMPCRRGNALRDTAYAISRRGHDRNKISGSRFAQRSGYRKATDARTRRASGARSQSCRENKSGARADFARIAFGVPIERLLTRSRHWNHKFPILLSDKTLALAG